MYSTSYEFPSLPLSLRYLSCANLTAGKESISVELSGHLLQYVCAHLTRGYNTIIHMPCYCNLCRWYQIIYHCKGPGSL